MNGSNSISAKEALEKLKQGNKFYVENEVNTGDISFAKRKYTFENGQRPFAVIISCSDSRVIPECIFNAGIGDLFVIRVAGNVMDDHQLGSVEYAAEHLGIKLIVVYIKFITDEIKNAVGNENDEYKACCMNIMQSVSIIEKSFEINREEERGLKVIGALYHTESGKVDFGINSF